MTIDIPTNCMHNTLFYSDYCQKQVGQYGRHCQTLLGLAGTVLCTSLNDKAVVPTGRLKRVTPWKIIQS